MLSSPSCEIREDGDLRHEVAMDDSYNSPPEDFEAELGLTVSDGRTPQKLLKGQDLSIGQGLVSPDQRFSAVLRAKGQFVFYSQATVIWSNGLQDPTAARLKLMDNGDLRVIDKAGKNLWSAGTGGSGASTLTVTNKGQLILSNAQGESVWSQGKCCAAPKPRDELRPQLVGRWSQPFTKRRRIRFGG